MLDGHQRNFEQNCALFNRKRLGAITLPLTLCLMASVCNTKTNDKNMQLTSTAFTHQADIPTRYTCQGENISPELKWKELPPNTKTLALIMDDPDAPQGPFIHWVAWNIDPKVGHLKENIKPEQAQDVVHQGLNSAGKPGYMGPCPPTGSHRYFFKLYALDKVLNLPASTSKGELESAMNGHIIKQTELMGRYKKS